MNQRLDRAIGNILRIVLKESPSRDALLAVGELHAAHAEVRREEAKEKGSPTSGEARP